MKRLIAPRKPKGKKKWKAQRKTTLHVELADAETPLVPIAQRFFPECLCLTFVTSGAIICSAFVEQGAQCVCLALRCWNKASPLPPPPPPPPPDVCDSGGRIRGSRDDLSPLWRRPPGFTVADVHPNPPSPPLHFMSRRWKDSLVLLAGTLPTLRGPLRFFPLFF